MLLILDGSNLGLDLTILTVVFLCLCYPAVCLLIFISSSGSGLSDDMTEVSWNLFLYFLTLNLQYFPIYYCFQWRILLRVYSDTIIKKLCFFVSCLWNSSCFAVTIGKSRKNTVFLWFCVYCCVKDIWRDSELATVLVYHFVIVK